MEKQTAVKWLAKNLKDFPHVKHSQLFRDLVQQAKEMDKQQKYSIDFLMWYSGMNQQQIENAHKRWINETFKSE
jgi:hypothetical protein